MVMLGVANEASLESGGSSPLRLCCDPHHYFDEKSESCLPSGQIFQAAFHDNVSDLFLIKAEKIRGQ